MSGGIVKLTQSGANALKRVLTTSPRLSQGGVALPAPHKTPFSEGGVFKFEATEDWSALGIIKAKQLRWSGSTLQLTGDTIDIRDYMGLGGKKGMRGAYFVEDGVNWHLATPCPPQETQTPTQTFA